MTTFEYLAPMTRFLDYADFSLPLFESIMFRNSIQDGTKFLLSTSKIPSDDVLESLTN